MKPRFGAFPFFLVLMGLWWLTLVATPAGAARRRVEFRNIPPSLISELRQKVPEAFQPTTTYADMDRLVQAVMETNNFEDVSVEGESTGDGEKLIVVGRALRRVQGITINGHHLFSSGEVREILGLQSGDIFVRKKLVDGADRLKAKYGEMSYFNAAIEISFDVDKENHIQVKVDISEGSACLIRDISIDTANKSLSEALLRRLARHLERPLSESRVTAMRETIESYFADNRFLMAQLSQPQIQYNLDRTRAEITFKVENPTRFELIFDGNRVLTSPTLLRHLEIGQYARTAINPALDINNRIIEIYRARGFAFVQSEYREKEFNNLFLKRVYYKIKENKRVKIESLEFTGRMTRPSEYYAQFVTDNSSEMVQDGYFQRSGLDLGLKNLQIELQNQGYLRAKIGTIRANFSEDRTSVQITVTLDEGPLTKIDSITFKGNQHFSSTELTDQLTVVSGGSLKLTEIENSITNLKDFYTSRGYLEMALINENQDLVQYNNDNTEAALIFNISEGPQVRVAKIVIEGNQITQNNVILREISFKEGDILTPTMINESTIRLQRLGLFSQISITTSEHGTPIANRTVVISVNESNPGIFTSGLGFSDEANLTYRGYLGVTYRNLGGTARAISSRAELSYASDPRISYLENRFQLAYFEPFIFDTRTRSRISYTHFQSVINADFFEVPNLVTIQQSDDVRILLERDLSLHSKLTWTLYGLERSHIFEKNNLQPESDRFIATIGPTFDIDYRDNPFNPTTGSFTRFVNEYSDPLLGSDDTIKYWKLDAQYTKYHRPFGGSRLVWANQVRGGSLNSLSDREGGGVPYEKAFFLGGRSTIRGFEPATERFPRAEQLGGNNPNFVITNWVMPSHSQYFLVKSEFRFPIYGDFGGAIFYDGGAVYIDGIRLDPVYRDSVGAGLRFSTPVGPVNLEAGYKLNRQNAYHESPYRVHFSIGTF